MRRKRRNWALADANAEPRVSNQDAKVLDILAKYRVKYKSPPSSQEPPADVTNSKVDGPSDVTVPQVDGPGDEAEECGEIVPKVFVLPRPWKTPEGTVNRPVLRMMLLGVLLHIMAAPGVSLKNLVKKYGPILHPVPLLEILEVTKYTFFQR